MPAAGRREGLCASCRHARRVVSGKGSVFVLCGLSARDPAFPKYPPLPVLACRGHARQQEELPDAGDPGRP